jgi:hypothetical protein
LPDKGVPLPKAAPRSPAAVKPASVPTPTRKPYPPSSNRPDNVGAPSVKRTQKPVYFGPTEQRSVEDRKIATNKAMQSAQQRTKDIAAKRQFVRNQPPAPTAFAARKTASPGPHGAQYSNLNKSSGLPATARDITPSGKATARVPSPMQPRPAVVAAGKTVVKPSSAVAAVKPSPVAAVKPTSSATPASSTFSAREKTAGLLAKARANSARADAKARAAQGGQPRKTLGIWR